MAATRELTAAKKKKIYDLKQQRLVTQQVAKQLRISRRTVQKYWSYIPPYKPEPKLFDLSKLKTKDRQQIEGMRENPRYVVPILENPGKLELIFNTIVTKTCVGQWCTADLQDDRPHRHLCHVRASITSSTRESQISGA